MKSNLCLAGILNTACDAGFIFASICNSLFVLTNVHPQSQIFPSSSQILRIIFSNQHVIKSSRLFLDCIFVGLEQRILKWDPVAQKIRPDLKCTLFLFLSGEHKTDGVVHVPLNSNSEAYTLHLMLQRAGKDIGTYFQKESELLNLRIVNSCSH